MKTLEELEKFVAEEAKAEGPAALADLQAQRERFRLAREIGERRKQLKLTQVQLSERSGVPQSVISKIESGAVNATEGTLLRVLQPLGCTLSIVTVKTPALSKLVKPGHGQTKAKVRTLVAQAGVGRPRQ